MMSKERFIALAEAFGGDLERWPDAEREAAEAFLAAEPETAQAILNQAAALDALLAEAAIAPPSAALHRKIAASGARRAAFLPHWATAAAAAITLTVGGGAGWMGAGVTAAAEDDSWLYADAFTALGDADPLWEDLS